MRIIEGGSGAGGSCRQRPAAPVLAEGQGVSLRAGAMEAILEDIVQVQSGKRALHFGVEPRTLGACSRVEASWKRDHSY